MGVTSITSKSQHCTSTFFLVLKDQRTWKYLLRAAKTKLSLHHHANNKIQNPKHITAQHFLLNQFWHFLKNQWTWKYLLRAPVRRHRLESKCRLLFPRVPRECVPLLCPRLLYIKVVKNRKWKGDKRASYEETCKRLNSKFCYAKVRDTSVNNCRMHIMLI